jgi:hypothetical protein
MATDRYADGLLDRVAGELRQLEGRPALELPSLLRPVVRRTLVEIRPDGSWPDSVLLQEALRAYVDFVDAALSDQSVEFDELERDDRRWLDACRQCSESFQLFDDLLCDLRADLPTRGPSTSA